MEHKNFQLLGITSMFIASKYEEIYAPETRDFVYISDKTYTREDIFQMELSILAALDFDILCISPFMFLQRYHFISKPNTKDDDKIFYLAQYLLELSLMEYRQARLKSSLKAAAALLIARKFYKLSWSDDLIKQTNYTITDLKGFANDLFNLFELAPKIQLKNCYNKFSMAKFGEVAKMVYSPKNK